MTVRLLAGRAELQAVESLFGTIWQTEPAAPMMTTELLCAFAVSGNYVAGAFLGADLVGASVGFFAPPAEQTLHSHITGVVPAAAGHSVGLALKQHQRAWALERGATTITWTFDPLVARNAHFNLAKLGATATAYLPDFYGPLHDRINGDDDTDRLLLRWNLLTPAGPVDAGLAREQGATVALDRSPGGEPVPGPAGGRTVLVAVPKDIEKLRVTDPERARQWRVGLRETLTRLLAEGATITGYDRSGWYVVTR